MRFDNIETSKTAEAARLFSSSTTGLPKAAMVSYYDTVAQYTLKWTNDERIYDIRRLLTFPIFHADPVPVSYTTILKARYMGFVMRRFDLQ